MKLSKYIAAMKHAIRGNPAPGHDLYETFNQAGRALYSAHPWGWLTVGPRDCPAVAGSDRIALPIDFGTLISVVPTNTGQFVRVVSAAEWLDRQRNVGPQGTRHTVTFRVEQPGMTPGEQPGPTALITPTPATNAEPTLRIVYTARWVDLTSEDGDRTPPVPSDYFRALQLIAQGMAVLTERDDDAPNSYNAEARTELNRLIGLDGRRQPKGGTMRGGFAEQLARASGCAVDDNPVSILQVQPD